MQLKQSFIYITIVLFSIFAPKMGMAQQSCDVLLSKLGADHFESAYFLYLKNQRTKAVSVPEVISFKSESYKVLDFLGSGYEGAVFRVEGKDGNKSILKQFSRPIGGFIRQFWDYYKMNKGARAPYKVIGIDYKNKVFQFEDLRGIPLNKIGELLLEVEAPLLLTEIINQKISAEGLRVLAEQNVVLDIDKGEFVAIDPH